MKEDKSTVSAAPHWLDNKQTPLLINFPPFPHGSPPVTPAGVDLGSSEPSWCPRWWGEDEDSGLGRNPSPCTLLGVVGTDGTALGWQSEIPSKVTGFMWCSGCLSGDTSTWDGWWQHCRWPCALPKCPTNADTAGWVSLLLI